MKALHIAIASHAYPNLDGSNAGEFVHGLASALVRLGHRVHAVVPQPFESPRFSEMDGVQLEFYKARDQVSYGRASNDYVRIPRAAVAFSLMQGALKLRQVVHEHKSDIIHAHWAIPMGFVASLVKVITGTPLVITTHGRDVYVNPEVGAIIPNLWYARPFLRFALQHADRVVAVSHDCARYAISAGTPAKRMVLINNGTNTKRFSPSDVGTAEVRKRHSIGEHNKLILVVGSLKQYKGIDLLIEAMPRILEVEPLAVALVVGEGPERETLIEFRDSLGLQNKVLFAGHIPNAELAPYENACDVFVLPSRRESFGIAAIEAMACAKPVIGTKVGGLAEVIDDFQTGLLIGPDDVKQLAETILRVLSDKALATRLGNNARRKVEMDFDWLNVARRTVTLYESVIHTERVV